MYCNIKKRRNIWLWPCALNIFCWGNQLVSFQAVGHEWIPFERYVYAWYKLQCFLSVMFFGVSSFGVFGLFYFSLNVLINQSDQKRLIMVTFGHFWNYHHYFWISNPSEKFMSSASQSEKLAGHDAVSTMPMNWTKRYWLRTKKMNFADKNDYFQ